MNFNFDINVHPSDNSSLEKARNRFLGSLGVSDCDLPDPENIETTESIDEENESLILSSGPDDFELPGAGESVPDRFSSLPIVEETDQPLSSQVVQKSPDTSIAVEEKQEAPIESLIPASPVALATDLNEVLNLSCPECEGELVLNRRHIGVEGACVWCHTSIIAAESPIDGAIRIVPILGRQQPKIESAKKTLPPPPVLPVAEITAEPVIEEPIAITESVVEMTVAEPVIEEPIAITESVVEMTVAEPVIEEPVAITESVVEMTATEPVIEEPVAITESVVEMTVAEPEPEEPVAITESVVEMTVAEPVIEEPVAITESVVEMTVAEPVIEEPVAITESVVEMTAAEPEAVEISPLSLSFGDFLNPTNPVKSTGSEELRFAAGEFASPIELTPEPQGFFPPVDAGTVETQSSLMGSKQEIPQNNTNESPFPTGFGAFLSGSHVLTESPNDAAALPSTFSGEPVTLPTEPETTEFSGFQSPSPWGPPTKIAADPSEIPPIDLALTAESGTPPVHDQDPPSFSVDPMAGFASAFAPLSASAPPAPKAELPDSFGSSPSVASEGTAEPVIESFQPTAGSSTGDDFAAAFSAAGFAPPSPPGIAIPTAAADESILQSFDSLPFIQAETSAVCDTKNPEEESLPNESGFSFHNSPSPHLLFGNAASTEKRTFALPGSDFSTGSSFQEKVDAPSTLDSGNPTSWGISEPIGFVGVDSAPNSFPGISDSATTAENLFSESPLPVIGNKLPPALPTEYVASSSTPTEPALASLSLEPSPASKVTPTVVSQPLGVKPKAQVRKGFVVLMVVILGFACGAALASFVLPVDEYVQTARNYMEQKFSMGSVIQQVPATSSLASDAASEENRDSQP
jgi:hypothetical protein